MLMEVQQGDTCLQIPWINIWVNSSGIRDEKAFDLRVSLLVYAKAFANRSKVTSFSWLKSCRGFDSKFLARTCLKFFGGSGISFLMETNARNFKEVLSILSSAKRSAVDSVLFLEALFFVFTLSLLSFVIIVFLILFLCYSNYSGFESSDHINLRTMILLTVRYLADESYLSLILSLSSSLTAEFGQILT